MNGLRPGWLHVWQCVSQAENLKEEELAGPPKSPASFVTWTQALTQERHAQQIPPT